MKLNNVKLNFYLPLLGKGIIIILNLYYDFSLENKINDIQHYPGALL